MADRNKMRPRRRTYRGTGSWADENGNDWPFFVEVGYTIPEGVDARVLAREVFVRIKGVRATGMMTRLMDDVATILSLLLQHGETLTNMKRRLGRLGGYPLVVGEDENSTDFPMSSLIGGVISEALRLEDELNEPAAAYGSEGSE